MQKELIELQVGIPATCVIILDALYKEIGQSVSMNASVSDEYLFAGKTGNPFFREKLDMLASNGKPTYFILRNIDNLNVDMQNRYLGLVKDREFFGYELPDNVVVAFTVSNKENLKKFSKELYHFSVVCL